MNEALWPSVLKQTNSKTYPSAIMGESEQTKAYFCPGEDAMFWEVCPPRAESSRGSGDPGVGAPQELWRPDPKVMHATPRMVSVAFRNLERERNLSGKTDLHAWQALSWRGASPSAIMYAQLRSPRKVRRLRTAWDKYREHVLSQQSPAGVSIRTDPHQLLLRHASLTKVIIQTVSVRIRP